MIRIGTRGSDLALLQSRMVANALKKIDPSLELKLVRIKTQGDKKQNTSEANQGDKYDWILELESELLDSNIDFAVHSGKDVPAEINSETTLTAVLERKTPYDAFVGASGHSSSTSVQFKDLPERATVGTSSLRRKAELLRLRPDLNVIEHRGNVPTRVKKLRNNKNLVGIVLASAGLERLGLGGEISSVFTPEEIMPCVNQGILVIQYRKSRPGLAGMLAKIEDDNTKTSFIAERACVSILNADCNSAVGIFAVASGTEVSISCRILSPDGKSCVQDSLSGPRENAESLGINLAKNVLLQGGKELLLAASPHG